MSKELDEALEKLHSVADAFNASALRDTLTEYLELEKGEIFFVYRLCNGTMTQYFGFSEERVRRMMLEDGFSQKAIEKGTIARVAVIPIIEVEKGEDAND